jgi:hypothetical protein
MIILTLGERGAFLADVDGQRLVPGFKVKTVDSTGAGDTRAQLKVPSAPSYLTIAQCFEEFASSAGLVRGLAEFMSRLRRPLGGCFAGAALSWCMAAVVWA